MNSKKIKRMVGISTLCAITFVLQFWICGILPKLPIGPGGTAINLALIPVVVGAILYGPKGGLTVGLFLGVITLMPGQGAEGFYVNWYMTILAIILCLLKTGLAGFVAGEVVVFLMSEYTDVNFLLFGATGMAVSIVVAWLLSLGSYIKDNK